MLNVARHCFVSANCKSRGNVDYYDDVKAEIKEEIKLENPSTEKKQDDWIEKIEFVISEAQKPESVNKNNFLVKQENLADNIWGKMRGKLRGSIWNGVNGNDIERNWFSSNRIEALIEEKNKTITLIASSLFIRKWIEQNYAELLEILAKNFDYEYLGVQIQQ